MTADRRWWLAPGAAVAASLLFLAWLAAGLRSTRSGGRGISSLLAMAM
jgi:hypothetical protein